MPGELTQYGANIALDHVSGRANVYTAASRTTYVGLSRSVAGGGVQPSDTVAGTELAVAGYARQAITWTAPTGDPSAIENNALITFGPFTADPQEVGFVELWDAATGGNRLAWWTADTARDAAVNESIQIVIGGLDFTLD